MKASQLRDLTRNYAAGRLDRDAYLAARERLIDDVIAGNTVLQYRRLGPAETTRGRAQRHWLVTGGSVMLVGLLVIASLAYFFDAGSTTGPAGKPPVAAAEKNPGAERLEAFLSAGDWSEASLARLERDWSRLSAFHRESARRSAPFRRLKHETTQRISEQEALLAAGEMEALLQATRLREFGRKMGMPPENR